MKARLHWVDTLKAICIICVYITHTDIFIDYNTVLGKFVYPFYVNAFFFISGYLLYRKYLHCNFNYSLTEFKNGVLNCIYRLAIPTIIFSVIIYIPKILFHNQAFNLKVFATDIFGGTSFWFTSALFIAQITILFMFLTKKKSILFYLISTSFIFITLQTICDFTPQPAINYFPWFWRTGLIYTFIMTIGGVYAKYENEINMWIIAPMICTSVIGYYMIYIGEIVPCLGLSGRCNVTGLITSISTIIILAEIVKHLNAVQVLIYIGKNSIIFYFFSGAIPALISTTMIKIGIQGISLLLVSFLLSISCSYILTHIIVMHFSFLTDIRLLKKQG